MFHKGPEDGGKYERSGETSPYCISNQFENGIPIDQNWGAR